MKNLNPRFLIIVKTFFDNFEIELFSLHSNVYWNQLEVTSLKNLFFLAALKLHVKDSFGYNKELERMEKTSPTI